MDPDTARWVLTTIVVGATVVWLLALLFVFNTFRATVQPLAQIPFEASNRSQAILLSGESHVSGDRATLSQRLAQALGSLANPAIGPITIQKRSERQVHFSNTAQSVVGMFEGQVTLSGVGSQVRLAWQVVLTGRPALVTAAIVCLVLGLCAIVFGAWMISSYVVDHPQPAIRNQTFQMLQVVHFLWLPFLFAGIRKRTIRMVRDTMETLIQNLAHRG